MTTAVAMETALIQTVAFCAFALLAPMILEMIAKVHCPLYFILTPIALNSEVENKYLLYYFKLLLLALIFRLE